MTIRGELASSGPAHPPQEAGRQAGRQQLEPERGKLSPRDGIPYQTSNRLPVANQVFLGSWTVDIHQEGRSQRSAPHKRHTAHLRGRSHCEPRKPGIWDGGGDKTHRPPKESALTKHLSPELLRPEKGTKCRPNQVYVFVEYSRT